MKGGEGMSDAEERMFNLLMECPPELDSERGNGRASAVDPPWREHLQSLGAIDDGSTR